MQRTDSEPSWKRYKRTFIGEGGLRSQGRPPWVCGGHSDTRRGFFARSSAFSCQYKSINAPYSRSIHLSQMLHNDWQHHSIKIEQISAFVGGFNLSQQRTHFIGYWKADYFKISGHDFIQKFYKRTTNTFSCFPISCEIFIAENENILIICYKNSVSFLHRVRNV